MSKTYTYFQLLRKACVKCGYLPFPGQTQHVEYQTDEYVADPTKEVLKLTCQRCGYWWEIDVLDEEQK